MGQICFSWEIARPNYFGYAVAGHAVLKGGAYGELRRVSEWMVDHFSIVIYHSCFLTSSHLLS